MHPRTEKGILFVTIVLVAIGYLTGSWFIVKYGMETNDNLLVLSPLLWPMIVVDPDDIKTGTVNVFLIPGKNTATKVLF